MRAPDGAKRQSAFADGHPACATQEIRIWRSPSFTRKAQKFKDAVEVLTQGRKHIPGSPNFLLPLGNNLVWAEQYKAGIDVLNELIAKAPGTAEAYIRLAEAYRNTGRGELEVHRSAGSRACSPTIRCFTS